MFAASAIRTNAGIAARRAAEKQLLLKEQSARLQRIAAREGAGVLVEHIDIVSPAQRIIDEIADQHGLSSQDLKGHSRHRHVCAARQHAMYEIRRQCPRSTTTTIGRMLGGRDHTTTMHAIREWPKKAVALGIPCEPINLPVVKGYTPEAAHG